MLQNLQNFKVIQKINSIFLSDEKVSDSDFIYFYGTYSIATILVLTVCVF